jgi:phosphate-selective porin OprO/OprP
MDNSNPSISTTGRRQYRWLFRTWLPIACMVVFSAPCFGQETPKTVPDGTEGDVLTVLPKDSLIQKLPANQFDGSYSTLKLGFGYVGDYASYIQDDVFEHQTDSAGVNLQPKYLTRDFRVMASGALKTKRTITWKFAYFYDGDKKSWLIRETGVIIGVPELSGHFFIGRTKEGYSSAKVMNGHSIIGQERQIALDVIPILADGIKWFGYLPKSRILWNVGYYNDFISEGQGFSTYEWQVSGRVGWLPYYDKEKQKVIHFAANLRYGEPLNGKITLKSRPESNPLPFVINTGAFEADYSTHIGAELYYSTGNFLVGTEVMVHNFQSHDFEDHKFYGGEVVLSYLFTGAKRPYNTVGSVFGFVPVEKSVFKGGGGEWEAVLRVSTLDLNDGSLDGGQFTRITPMVNWFLSKTTKVEFIYGYGVLDRFGMKGNIQLFQTRLILTVL